MQNVLKAPHPATATRPKLAAPDARFSGPVAAHGFTPAEVRQALIQLLASQEFCKAQRMCRLMKFLVDKELAGAIGETGEYAIGIDVFDRDARSYNTCEDPIVRVQVGRLRDRLKAYYAASGARAELRFSIPIGSYMPSISRHGDLTPLFTGSHLLAILPLLCFTQNPIEVAFKQGLSEELAHQLFKVFGHKIVSHTFSAPGAGGAARAAPGVSHVLEGSVRMHGDMVRTSMRLIDSGAGCIAWSEQFDRRGPPEITLQEDLSLAICSALERYFAQG